jgi:2'-5' RNA ligase
MIRLFAAIALPDEAAGDLARHQNGLREARWRTAEQLHLTLRFIGEVDEPRAADIASELEKAVVEPFQLELSGVGAFGEGHQVRALWAGVADNPALDRLAGRCESAARRAGCAPETRNFAPHVTLAYLKNPDPAQVGEWISEHNLLKTDPFSVLRFGLYSSWPGENGSRYELERFYRLGDA